MDNIQNSLQIHVATVQVYMIEKLFAIPNFGALDDES